MAPGVGTFVSAHASVAWARSLHDGHANDGMGWWMVFGGLFWLVTFALLAYVFAALLSPAREPREPREQPPAARRETPR